VFLCIIIKIIIRQLVALYAAHQQHGALRAWAEQHAATSVVKVERVVSEPKPVAVAKGAEGGEGQEKQKGSTFAEESLTAYLCAQPAMQALVSRFVQVRICACVCERLCEF
jgi:hypothetical protein